MHLVHVRDAIYDIFRTLAGPAIMLVMAAYYHWRKGNRRVFVATVLLGLLILGVGAILVYANDVQYANTLRAGGDTVVYDRWP
jgi:hypothetical protein